MNCVGIDVSKGKSMIAVMRPFGEVVVSPFEVRHTANELSELAGLLKSLDGETRVVMESTGNYHAPVAWLLHDAGLYVSVVNAMLVHDYGNNSLRRAKTDKKDAVKLANYGLDHWLTLPRYIPEEDTRLMLKICYRQYQQYSKVQTMLKNNLISLLDTTYKVLVIILGVATCAQIVGFPIGSIVAGAGLVGLTISLAAQESASNLFSGIVILLDKPFSIGDWITVGNVEGEVIDINFRSTRIRSMDHSVVIITNSQICASTVQNAALRTMRPYKFTLGVTYGTTRAQLEKLMADLQAMLDNSPYTNKGTNIVRLTSFGDSSINILISAYLTTNVYATFLQQQNDLNLNIMDVMQADGVDFAFPSTSVYIEKN